MAGPDVQKDAKYKGAEVCRLADVQPYVLRYWESEFPFLAPNRGATGPRSYSELDLQLIRRIKQLLYDEGYTIAGAKKRLEAELKKGVPLFDDDELGASEPQRAVQLAGDIDLDLPPPPFDPDDTGSGMVQKPKRKSKAAPPPPPPAVGPDAGEAEEMESEGGPAVEAAPAPAPGARSGRRNVPPPIPAPARAAPDPRLASTLTELKEILAVLSKD